MTKKNKITIIILAVILVVTGTLAVMTLNPDFLKKLSSSKKISDTQELSSVLVSDFQSEYPLVQTQKKDLFYEIYPDGTVKFYTFANGAFSAYTGKVETKEIKVSCSYQNIPVKLFYTKTDKGMIGYGLFNSGQKSDVKLFNYVFVRMMTCPSSYKKIAKTDNVILVDTDEQDVYNPNKTYSDIYSFDISSGKTVQIINQRDRLVQENATFREDWVIFTDHSLNTMTKYNLFASARNHDTAAEIKEYDIMSIENSKAYNKNSTTTVSSSPSVHIWFDSDAYYCLANTKNGFDLIRNNDKKSPLASFEGNFAENYLVSENWIFNKTNSEITNALNGNAVKFKDVGFEKFAGFTANESGSKFVVFGGDGDTMALYNKGSDSVSYIKDAALFNYGILNFSFIDDSTIVVSSYNSDQKAVNHICKV
ncbi:MAG: hypothetical protein KBT46_05390 [Ruminococcus sp.]|nr:hypothetical protein [Candidatus Copronaster equi]